MGLTVMTLDALRAAHHPTRYNFRFLASHGTILDPPISLLDAEAVIRIRPALHAELKQSAPSHAQERPDSQPSSLTRHKGFENRRKSIGSAARTDREGIADTRLYGGKGGETAQLVIRPAKTSSSVSERRIERSRDGRDRQWRLVELAGSPGRAETVSMLCPSRYVA